MKPRGAKHRLEHGEGTRDHVRMNVMYNMTISLWGGQSSNSIPRLTTDGCLNSRKTNIQRHTGLQEKCRQLCTQKTQALKRTEYSKPRATTGETTLVRAARNGGRVLSDLTYCKRRQHDAREEVQNRRRQQARHVTPALKRKRCGLCIHVLTCFTYRKRRTG
jgi:hypothetical protein